jgi:hypothetical protein
MIYVVILELGPHYNRDWHIIYTGLDKFRANSIKDRVKEIVPPDAYDYWNIYVIERECGFEDKFEEMISNSFE